VNPATLAPRPGPALATGGSLLELRPHGLAVGRLDRPATGGERPWLGDLSPQNKAIFGGS